MCTYCCRCLMITGLCGRTWWHTNSHRRRAATNRPNRPRRNHSPNWSVRRATSRARTTTSWRSTSSSTRTTSSSVMCPTATSPPCGRSRWSTTGRSSTWSRRAVSISHRSSSVPRARVRSSARSVRTTGRRSATRGASTSTWRNTRRTRRSALSAPRYCTHHITWP